MHKLKNERNNLGFGSKHIDNKGQVCRNGLTPAEVLNVAGLAPAGVGGLASDATLQLCSVSAASGRSSCSLGESRKRPRAQDGAGCINGENFGEDVHAIITSTLEKKASAHCGLSFLYILIIYINYMY